MLVVTEGLIKLSNAIIEFDNSTLIEQAHQLTTKYTDLVVNEDDLPEMKSICADLNKVTKALDDQRKAIKSQYNAPLAEFEGKIKEVTSIIESTVTSIKSKTEVYEQKRIKQKESDVSCLIIDMLTDSKLSDKYYHYVVLKPEYLQITFKGKKLTEDIQSQIDSAILIEINENVQNELINLKIKTRELLLERLNEEFGRTVKYSEAPFEKFSDEDVANLYKAKVPDVIIEKLQPQPNIDTGTLTEEYRIEERVTNILEPAFINAVSEKSSNYVTTCSITIICDTQADLIGARDAILIRLNDISAKLHNKGIIGEVFYG